MASSATESDRDSFKTVITVSGSRSVTSRLVPGLTKGLPGECIEWKRSFGRASKSVCLHAHWVAFQPEVMANTPKGQNVKQLRGVPLLHTFWIECQDIDAFKSHVKEDVLNWLSLVKKCGVAHDWVVILVENSDAKKANKLIPRTSVLDKLKTDVGGKTPERCLSLIDPTKNDSRASESWQTLLHRLRLLVLQAYNRILGKFEDSMRSQRERRNDPNWNFCDYFLLQEELAFVYEMLGVYDEALVQYDELDALFTQFVLNSNVTESPQWLKIFCERSSNWTGLSFNPRENETLRENIKSGTTSLVDFRNYLFARQCIMLLKVHKPWEVAQRSLPFLHNCVQEISILELSYPAGSIDCWVLLSCLEILLTCEQYSDSSNKIQYYCLFTASLWAYAREKLQALGYLCGLMPGMKPSSEQLHRVVELSSGIRDDDNRVDTMHLKQNQQNPVQKLKEALSSTTAFQKYYLELSELAISTYKHIGHIRSARLIGIDLAEFYLRLGQIPQAVTFLVDALKNFHAEEWSQLEFQTLTNLAKCYKILDEKEKLVRILVQLAGREETENKGIEEIMDIVTQLNEVIVSEGDALLRVTKAELETPTEKLTPNCSVTLSVEIENKLGSEIAVDDFEMALTYFGEVEDKHDLLTRRKSSATIKEYKHPGGEMKGCFCPNPLQFVEQLDYREDRSLSAARLVCLNSGQLLRRKDSHGGAILKEATGNANKVKTDYVIRGQKQVLKPGMGNKIMVTGKIGEVGRYKAAQLTIKVSKLEILCNVLTETDFDVIREQPNISINRVDSENIMELLSGVEQLVNMTIYTGSFYVEEGTKLSFQCSRGLVGCAEEAYDESAGLKATFEVTLPAAKPFETLTKMVILQADLPFSVTGGKNKDQKTIEHTLSISDPWSNPSRVRVLSLAFYNPFQISVKVSTSFAKKFVEIIIKGASENTDFQFRKPLMKLTNGEGYSIRLINDENTVVEVNKSNECTFYFQLVFPNESDSSPDEDIPKKKDSEPEVLKTEFKVLYRQTDNQRQIMGYEQERSLKIFPELRNFKTLYILRSKVIPAKGGEICRAATICSLVLELEQINETDHTALMYEVLADQAVWAVCGRAASVMDMSGSKAGRQSIAVEVMPLVGGHLLLPKVRISKYIPAETTSKTENSKGSRDSLFSTSSVPSQSASSMPRLEPFSPGQIFNASRFVQIHVLSSSTSTVTSTSNAALGSMQTIHSRPVDSGPVSLP